MRPHAMYEDYAPPPPNWNPVKVSNEAMWKDNFGGIVIATWENIHEVAACLGGGA